jgi:sialidase-1
MAFRGCLRYLLCVLLLTSPFAFGKAAPDSSNGLSEVDLFHQGDLGVHTFRIPALVQSKRGVLIAVVDARFESTRDLPAKIALAMRRSVDNGAHWTPIRIILQPKTGGVGDASLLLDRESGRIWCFHGYGPPGIGFNTAKPGSTTGPDTLQLHAIYSDDDGETWSAPRDLTPQIKDPAWQAFFATSGTAIETSTGRFLLPIVVRDAKGQIHSANLYSDDHGESWRRGEFIGTGTDESHAVELPGGVILQNMRTSKGTRAIARSTDGGRTFGAVTQDSTLVDPGCNAGIVRYRNQKTDALIFTNAASHKRENLTVKVSYDEGHTWPSSRVLYPGPAAYSTVIPLQNGDVAVLYERGAVDSIEKITFARFPFGWITTP